MVSSFIEIIEVNMESRRLTMIILEMESEVTQEEW